MKQIGKKFGNVRVLEGVDFDIYPGEVHVLAGENGAGKSTLIKILSGVHTSFQGEIWLNGEKVAPSSPLEANQIGISVIHQELSLIPAMSVADNLFLGRPDTKAGFMRDKRHRAKAQALVKDMGIEIDIDTAIENCSISIQQLIEITKAVSIHAKVIVMDEPSSALNARDVETLYTLIDKLKASGCGIVYISHRMEEIERLADRITVLRDGKYVGTSLAKDLPIPKLINWMVGRDISEPIARSGKLSGEEKLSVERVTVYENQGRGKKLVDGVSLSVKSGEILGIAGLQGSGASELLMGIFGGYEKKTVDQLILNGKRIQVESPGDAIQNGIAFLTNDRKATGLVLSMSITDNTCLADLNNLTKWGWISASREKKVAEEHGKMMGLRLPSYETEVGNLSGGNQQKVAIAKWLQIKPHVLLLDEPTRGIDIGAKHEIYALINELTQTGMAILLITSEMPELLALSDRIMVMHRGKITAEFTQDEATAEKVLEAAMGKEKTKS
ncbi:sugar ABC transporter ATP-binding protein [Paenibacillus sp. N3.4]|nr:sugar ABC transporter ATP-binding protein [Paenibacillus sp. N3.4]